MNNLEAYKMDGLGNDFIIFDNRKKSIFLTKDQIIKISNRNNIGCDQVIFIGQDKNHDAFLKFYNSDGGEISACGNGSRCVAYFLMKENNLKKTSLRTNAGILQAELNDKNLVSINIGQPNFEWDKIPLIKKIKIKVNGKSSIIKDNLSLYNYIKKIRIPIKKVAIELNREIMDKNRLSKIKLKNNDKIEIVHFIGGG